VSLRSRTLSRLRRLKPAWVLYNLGHWRRLRGNAAHYRRLGIRRSVLGPVSHRDIRRPGGEPPWLDRPGAPAALAEADLSGLPAPIAAKLPGWVTDGFLVLESFFEPDRIAEINAELARLFDSGAIDYHYRGNRIVDAFKRSDSVRGALTEPTLVRLLGILLGREVSLFQSINFVEGSGQRAHSDSFHMTTEPIGYLVAIWVALEDVAPDSGPVFYYPGSHRLPYLMSEDLGDGRSRLFLDEGKQGRYEDRVDELVAERGLEPVEFLAREGDVLVWHANLLHGGRPIERPGATRRSLVAHYFAHGVLCYHEVTERPALLPASSAGGSSAARP
jgi:ectoine hydroxylase-related dioxygenase (phytanoyl-CoA dioxygenase family)